MHIVGIIAWVLGAQPGFTWLVIYTVLVLYYIKRYMDKHESVRALNDFFHNIENITTSPTMKQNFWRITVTTTERFYVGTVENGHIKILDEFEKVPLPELPIIDVAKEDKNISAFLSFSPVYRW